MQLRRGLGVRPDGLRTHTAARVAGPVVVTMVLLAVLSLTTGTAPARSGRPLRSAEAEGARAEPNQRLSAARTASGPSQRQASVRRAGPRRHHAGLLRPQRAAHLAASVQDTAPGRADPGPRGPDPIGRMPHRHRVGLTLVPTGWTTTTVPLDSGGFERQYLMIRPPASTTGALPVVIVLPGRDLDPNEIERMSELIPIVGRAIMVYPAGYGLSWNAGGCCGLAHQQGVDDVAFLDDVVHHVLATQPDASPHAVYLFGFSNGGRMAYRMACEDPGAFAGVAAVEAVPVFGCSRLHPTPLVIVAQSGDPLLTVPVHGPEKSMEGYQEPTVGATVDTWRALEGCTDAAAVAAIGTARVQTFDHCPGGGRMEYALYAGGGHDWPLGDAGTPSAGELIWSFLHRGGLPVLAHGGSHPPPARHRVA